MNFWDFQAKDLITLAILAVTCWAVYYGPVKAVAISLDNEQRYRRERKKFEIFSILMRTRNLVLDPERVSNLNLVQVYFNDVPEVLRLYKEYMKTLNSFAAETEEAQAALFRERANSYINLLAELGQSVGVSLDKKDMQDLAYSPAGWATDEETLRKLRSLMIELLEGKRPIGIAPMISASANPFPPPPPSDSGQFASPVTVSRSSSKG